jgi:hypothetical protein
MSKTKRRRIQRDQQIQKRHRERFLAVDDLIGRGLRRPQLLIVDGAPGLENAIAAVCEPV